MPAPPAQPRQLLAVIELGGYPNLNPVYQRAGFEVTAVSSVRKAREALKSLRPDVVVTEFNYQSDFRDRTSSVETLLAALSRWPEVHMLLFYEREFAHQLERLKPLLPVRCELLAFPITESAVEGALTQLLAGEA
jgi:hypothetical protein